MSRPGSILEKILEHTDVIFEPLTILSRFDMASVRRVTDVIKQYEINVVNAQSSKDRYTTVLARWFFRLSVIVVHTRRQVSMSVGGFFQNLIYVQGTDKVVAVSEGVKQSLMINGIASKHIQVIHNGTPHEKYSYIDQSLIERLKQKLNIQPGDIVIGCISRRKKQEQLVKSLDLLGFPVKVIFVGIVADEELREAQRHLKLPHEILYEGEVPSSVALHYHKLFTCTVLCSVTEGLSQSLLESMYLGVPVVATEEAGNIDLIQHGENGFLFPDEDYASLSKAVKNVVDDTVLREKIIAGGITTAADTFSIDRTVRRYEDFYKSLLTSRKFYSNDSTKTSGPLLPTHSAGGI